MAKQKKPTIGSPHSNKPQNIAGMGVISGITNQSNWAVSKSYIDTINNPDPYPITGTLSLNGMDVNDFIKQVCDQMCIVPKMVGTERHPSVQAAYDDYKAVLDRQVSTELKEAYDKFRTIERLFKTDENKNNE